MITLVLGGARSGKSRYAEQLFTGDAAPFYIATGQALDDEMRERIAHHRERRDPRWQTIEEPLDLAGALRTCGGPVLVDCLTLWVGNLMQAKAEIDQEVDRLAQILPELPGNVALVSNEVGLGIVPDNAMAREFRDHAGRANQRIAASADRVVFIAAGLPLILKG
jgi:adenosylcobinamide kinase/adenosylcobinamide-phosphate guanylyltransferase